MRTNATAPYVPLLATLGLALNLAGCGREAETPAPPLRNMPPVDARLAPDFRYGPVQEDWRGIDTFAKSIEAVTTTVDAQTQEAAVDFRFRDLDTMDRNGAPYFRHIFGLRGTLTQNQGALTNPGVPDISAQLRCADVACLQSRLTLTKISGKLAGEAEVEQSTIPNASVLVNHWGEVKSGTVQGQLVQGMDPRRGQSYRATLRVSSVMNTPKVFLGVQFDFGSSVVGASADDLRLVKSAWLWARVGAQSLASLEVAPQNRSALRPAGYVVNAGYDAQRARASVEFIRNAATDDEESHLRLEIWK